MAHAVHGRKAPRIWSNGITKHGLPGVHARKSPIAPAAKKDPWKHQAEAKQGGRH